MKNILTFCFVLFIIGNIEAQNNSALPSVKLKNISGEIIDISQKTNNGKPTIISFWATYCKPCKEELTAISKKHKQWEKETGVEVIAVSIDNSRSINRVKPYVDGQGWDFTILLDSEGKLKDEMNVTSIPHTFLIDSNGAIVWEHKNYKTGDEAELYKELKSLNKK